MKCGPGIIAVIVLTVSIGSAAGKNTPCDQMRARQESDLVAQTDLGRYQSVSAEGNAEAKREEFADRMTELRDWESDLDKQAIELHQEISDLQSLLEQNALELERVKVDQKDVQRNIRELEHERMLFDKKDRLRRKMGKL